MALDRSWIMQARRNTSTEACHAIADEAISRPQPSSRRRRRSGLYLVCVALVGVPRIRTVSPFSVSPLFVPVLRQHALVTPNRVNTGTVFAATQQTPGEAPGSRLGFYFNDDEEELDVVGGWGHSPELHVSPAGFNQTRPMTTTSKQHPDSRYQRHMTQSSSIHSFNMDLRNIASSEHPRKAQEELERMIREQELQPDISSFHAVMEAWIHEGHVDEAEALLRRMEESIVPNFEVKNDNSSIGEDSGQRIPKPTEWTYFLVIQGWASDAKDDRYGKSASKALSLLKRMKSQGFEPNARLYGMVLDGWCRRAGIVRGAMQKAEALLREMEQAYEDSTMNATALNRTQGTGLRPNVLTYTSFIGGLSRSKEHGLASRAEAVLDRMEAHGVMPDMVAYTSVINCWAKTVSRREREMAASRAIRMVEDMERMYAKGVSQMKPSLITYSTVISAIGNSLDPKAPLLVTDILQRMYDRHESGEIGNVKPTTAVYNNVVYALSRAPRNRPRHAKRAEKLLQDMKERTKKGEKDVQPDVRTYAAVLRAWGRSRQADAAENAQRVLDTMEKEFERGETTVRPNYVCYTTVMGAWGHSRRADGLDRMEAILRQMEDGYEATLQADIRPNTVSYVTAIDAIVRSGDKNAAQRAQALVDRMVQLYGKGLGHVRPTRIVLNTLINAWSKSKQPGAARKAESIFKWMETQYQSGDQLVRPDEVSLCAVLNAWANQGDTAGAERAQQIWDHTKALYQDGDVASIQPTIMMPNIVIKAIARSKDTESVVKAERILLTLEEDYLAGKKNLRPDVTTYSSVINACAYYNGDIGQRKQALDTALRTFRKLSEMKGEAPNNITYGTLFKAIANLMPPAVDERDELVATLFDQCCLEGNVDSFVLSQLRLASPGLYKDLVSEPCGLGDSADDDENPKESIESVLRNIPPEWSTNVLYHKA